MTSHLIFLSVPGLRLADIDRVNTPMLYGWANRGAMAEVTPTFPCVTSCIQAAMFTGRPPAEHGIIANGFYHRERRQVEMWTGWNGLVQAPQLWDLLHVNKMTSAVWHAQNIKGASADFIITPAPFHEPDGTTKLWCYSKPDGLYQQTLDEFGHFPLQHYWGPLANIESTRWILRGAAWLNEKHAPNFHWIYIPHLDYALQKHGPNSPQAKIALAELDHELACFAERIEASRIGKGAVFLAAGEYAMTDVTGVIFPNRLLRRTGLLQFAECDGWEGLNFSDSQAFAMVDHQFAHVFLKHQGDDATKQQVVDLFRDVPGIAGVFAGDQRAEIGMKHPRSGEVVLVCDDAHWLAYYWWLDGTKAPPFAGTMDIHNKPGYDPVELFFDPKTRGIPLDASLVKGSHGVPATSSQHRTAVICSTPTPALHARHPIRDTDIFDLIQHVFPLDR